MTTLKKPPFSIESILKSRQFNPQMEFPESLKNEIHLCDSNLSVEDYANKYFRNVPLNSASFPKLSMPYYKEEKDVFYSNDMKSDKKAMKTAHNNYELAYVDEMSKRKEWCNQCQEIYEKCRLEWEKEKEDIKKSQTLNTNNEKNKNQAKKVLKDSSKSFDNDSDDDSSNDSYNEASSSDSDQPTSSTDSYSSSDSDDSRKTKMLSKPVKKASPRPKNSQEIKNKPKETQIDRDKIYEMVISGKVNRLTIIDEVLRDQINILQDIESHLKEEPDNEEYQKDRDEQQKRVDIVRAILKSKNEIPESPSMAPKFNINTEKLQQADLYKKKLALAKKEMEIEKMKKSNTHETKIETNEERRNLIDSQIDKDDVLFTVSDDDDDDDDDII